MTSEEGGSENVNLKAVKFESIKSTSMDSGEIKIRKFSDNYPNSKFLVDRRSASLSRSIKTHEKKLEEELNTKHQIDINAILNIDYVKSFSVKFFVFLII